MSIRVNPNILPDLLNSIQQAQQAPQNAIQEMATGRSVNNLSDNPSAAAELVGNNALLSQDDQYLSNLADIQGKFQVADSTLNSATQLMTKAISLGTEGANGTLSTANRQAIAAQVQALQQQMLSLANASYRGTYVFAGTDVTTQPFVQDSTVSSGVNYHGNSNVTTVQISQGQYMKTNAPGDQIFDNQAGSVFGALNNLANALTSGTEIGAATTAVSTALSQLNMQRVFYGTALNQVQNAQDFLNQDKVNLSTQQNQLVGANLAQVIAQESQDQVNLQAVLSVAGQILNLPNLLQYLK